MTTVRVLQYVIENFFGSPILRSRQLSCYEFPSNVYSIQFFRSKNSVIPLQPVCTWIATEKTAKKWNAICRRQMEFGDRFKKIDVNGEKAATLYKFLNDKQDSFLGDGIKWNFMTFLSDKDGKRVERFASSTSPKSTASKIDELLTK